MDHAVRANHRVLASVSRGYPRLAGSLITCYSPVRHSTHLAAFAFDLHASSTPPTFVLSQDQTLHLKSSSSFLSLHPHRQTDRSVHRHGRLRHRTRSLRTRQPRSHASHRGHAVCQRSPRTDRGLRRRAVRGAGEGSDRAKLVKTDACIFSRSRAPTRSRARSPFATRCS